MNQLQLSYLSTHRSPGNALNDKKCSKPFWGSPKVCLRWGTPSVSKALQRDGLHLRDSKGLGNIPKDNLMVLKISHGSVPQRPLCLQHKDTWGCLTQARVPLPFTRWKWCSQLVSTFKKEILNPFSPKLCNLQSTKLMKSQEKRLTV